MTTSLRNTNLPSTRIVLLRPNQRKENKIRVTTEDYSKTCTLDEEQLCGKDATKKVAQNIVNIVERKNVGKKQHAKKFKYKIYFNSKKPQTVMSANIVHSFISSTGRQAEKVDTMTDGVPEYAFTEDQLVIIHMLPTQEFRNVTGLLLQMQDPNILCPVLSAITFVEFASDGTKNVHEVCSSAAIESTEASSETHLWNNAFSAQQ